ncbi:MAG: DUF5946 family protein [Vicinamibacteria bacterium]
MRADEEVFHALLGYTLVRGDAAFIHQHAVDAYAAQAADAQTKPIKITFALVGLYLLIERQFTGKAIQRAHMDLARQNRNWPTFDLPEDRGSMTVSDVMATNEGPERDAAIHAWAASVWAAYVQTKDEIRVLLERYGIL